MGFFSGNGGGGGRGSGFSELAGLAGTSGKAPSKEARRMVGALVMGKPATGACRPPAKGSSQRTCNMQSDGDTLTVRGVKVASRVRPGVIEACVANGTKDTKEVVNALLHLGKAGISAREVDGELRMQGRGRPAINWPSTGCVRLNLTSKMVSRAEGDYLNAGKATSKAERAAEKYRSGAGARMSAAQKRQLNLDRSRGKAQDVESAALIAWNAAKAKGKSDYEAKLAANKARAYARTIGTARGPQFGPFPGEGMGPATVPAGWNLPMRTSYNPDRDRSPYAARYEDLDKFMAGPKSRGTKAQRARKASLKKSHARVHAKKAKSDHGRRGVYHHPHAAGAHKRASMKRKR